MDKHNVGEQSMSIVQLEMKTIAALTKQVELLDQDDVSVDQVYLACHKIRSLMNILRSVT